MAEPVECEIGLAMNESGDWFICKADEEDVAQQLKDNYDSEVVRTVKIKVVMRPPHIPEAIITVPDEAGETITATAE